MPPVGLPSQAAVADRQGFRTDRCTRMRVEPTRCQAVAKDCNRVGAERQAHGNVVLHHFLRPQAFTVGQVALHQAGEQDEHQVGQTGAGNLDDEGPGTARKQPFRHIIKPDEVGCHHVRRTGCTTERNPGLELLLRLDRLCRRR